MSAAVSLVGAAVRLGERTLWHDVDVEVHPGEFVALLGPNGVGKSTMLHAVLGLQRLAAGRIEVFGREPAAARPLVGYLPQRRSFTTDVRIRGVDLVGLGVDGTRWGVPLPRRLAPRRSAERARRVEEAIGVVGATAYATRPIGRLSGGEQQRLLIAQALVRSPRLLLLDEPLDSLDLPNQAAVAALVSSISRSGVAVVMVAHDVNPIVGYLDRVVYLGPGGAVAGPVDEVITGDVLSRVYGTPVEVLTAADGRVVVVGTPEAPSHHR